MLELLEVTRKRISFPLNFLFNFSFKFFLLFWLKGDNFFVQLLVYSFLSDNTSTIRKLPTKHLTWLCLAQANIQECKSLAAESIHLMNNLQLSIYLGRLNNSRVA